MATPTINLTLGHSPDPDDAFMFYALAQGKVSSGNYRLEHILQDIQTLNDRVRRQELDVSAISFHAFPYVSDQYALLPCGASMGDGYGPMLIARQPVAMKDLMGKRFAIPGRLTSAWLALQLFVRQLNFQIPEESIEIVAFDQIFDAVRQGKADVGLIIHEGQLTYSKVGFHLLVDLGDWWKKETGLPLPLGGNVVRKALGLTTMNELSKILSSSIRYGLDHLDEAMPHLKNYARDLDDELTRRFVKMYVNDYTVDYGETGRRAISEFLKRGTEAGLVPAMKTLEFVGDA